MSMYNYHHYHHHIKPKKNKQIFYLFTHNLVKIESNNQFNYRSKQKKEENTYINKQGQQAHHILQKIYAGMEHNHGNHRTSTMQILCTHYTNIYSLLTIN